MPDVTHDADDFARRRLSRHDGEVVCDAAADRILVRPEAAGHRLVDDGDAGCVAAIALVEGSAARDRNANGGEIVGPDHMHRRRRTLADRLRWFTGDRERAVVDEEARPWIERQPQGHRGRLDSGQIPQPRDQSLEERRARRRAGAAARQLDSIDDQHGRTAEPGVDPLEPREALHEQHSADRQHHRQRDFRHDQQLSRPLPGAGHQGAPRCGERVVQAMGADLEGGRNAEEQTGSGCEQEGERRHAAIDPDVVQPRDVGRC